LPAWCRYALVAEGEDASGKERMVPMSSSIVNVSIQNASAVLDFELTFKNRTDKPFEAKYEFPMEEDCTITGLKA